MICKYFAVYLWSVGHLLSCLIFTEISFIFLKIFYALLVTWELDLQILILYVLFMGNTHLTWCCAVLNRTLTKPYVASQQFGNVCQPLMTLDFHFYVVFILICLQSNSDKPDR
jgi:hypothetical protein